MHFIAHQLRTWNKKAYAEAITLETALGMLYGKRKTGKVIHLGPPLPQPSLILSATAHKARSHPAQDKPRQGLTNKPTGEG